jgi:hypothetical protein
MIPFLLLAVAGGLDGGVQVVRAPAVGDSLDGEVEWGCRAIRRVVTGTDEESPYVRAKTPGPVPVTLLLLAGNKRGRTAHRIKVPAGCAIEGVRFVEEPRQEAQNVWGLVVRVEVSGKNPSGFDIRRLWAALNPKFQSLSPASIERDSVVGLDTSR